MNSSILKARRLAAVALAVAAVPFAANTASAAPKAKSGKRATWSQPASAPATAAATTTSTTSSTPVSSVHAIGGYVFYNVTYLEAVELYFAAVAAAPAGYTPPPVTSVSATTTVSGTVDPAR